LEWCAAKRLAAVLVPVEADVTRVVRGADPDDFYYARLRHADISLEKS
jgi:hypothetical protein